MEEKFIKKITEKIDKQDYKNGLSRDMGNAIMGIGNKILSLENGVEESLNPLPTFEEFIERKRKSGYNLRQIEQYKKRSQPEAVAAYNSLVEEFNSRLDDIRDSLDILKEYENKFTRLILGE